MLNALGLGYSETKIKPYLKMAVQRIQIAVNKKTTSVKHQKREVAALLGDQKDEKARIKVEHIIRDDFVIEAYEILELLCELMHERIRQITNNKECPSDLKEAACSLIWAANSCDISELQEVKKHLSRKYGPEFMKEAEENANCCVNARLFNKLSYKPPSRMLVNGYLEEIANVYKVDWTLPVELEGELVVDESQPFSTPSGYSVNMAPGSGLTNAYNRSAASPQTTTAQASKPAPRVLSPEEQEEYDQFHKNQARSPNAATAPPGSPPPGVVYSPVPGAPPRFNYASTVHPGAAAPAPSNAVAPHPAHAEVVQKPSATPAVEEEENEEEDGGIPPPAPSTQITRNNNNNNDNGGGGVRNSEDYTPPPFAPGYTPPDTPPAPPGPPADPMEAMLARLNALK